MSNIPTLEELMKAGLHFGHNKSKWHPKMKPYIFTDKNKVHIINLEQTQKLLEESLEFIKNVVAKGGVVLFLGTKKQAKAIVKKAAQDCGMPYITERWLGGTFTNSKSVLGLVKNYKKLKEERETGKLSRYTKREQLKLNRKIEKLEPLIGGLSEMSKLPEVLFVIDVKHEKTAILEANRVKIPVVALCDTNVNPTRVTKVIPGNDDAIKGIELIANMVAQTINEAKKQVTQ